MSVILVAYERESEQIALEQLLAGRGHQVVRSANGLAALEAARREPPDAIVSDIVLPRMDGFALCRKWKQDERLQSVPFVFYTRRHDDPKYERFALELGAQRFLARTASPDALLGAIDELLPSETGKARSPPPVDGAAAKRAEALESMQQAHAAALERAQQVQTRLRSQIAELQSTNQRLVDGEARFRRVFEANPMPLWIADRATDGFITVNDAALALYGYDRAEFLALKQGALLAGDTDGNAADIARHVRKDGGRLVVSLATVEIEFDGRRADLVCAHDLTKRVATERQLREESSAHCAVIEAELIAQRIDQRRLRFMVDLFRDAGTLDEPEMIRRVVEQALAATDSPLAYLYFVDPAAKTIRLAAWRERGKPQATMPNAEAQPLARSGLFTECVRARHATSSNDLARKPQADGLPDLQRYLAVPMVADEQTVAVLGVANRDALYGEDDQRALSELADGAWHALQAKRAHAGTLAALQRSDVAIQAMIDGFVGITERHDPYTAGSAQRLATLAVALGREAGLDGERQHALRLAALLHDIGNIAVPAPLLAKPGPLSDAERTLVRTHAEEGRRLLAAIEFGAPVAEIVYQHHERCDGSGYPRGLKEDEILLEARILAIADTIEAMCSPRPHRPALGMDAAIEEINQAAGRLYDVHLVAACTRLIRQRGFTLTSG